jgi:hypothetical protein
MRSWRRPMKLCNDFLIGVEVNRIRRHSSKDWRHIPQSERALVFARRLTPRISRLHVPGYIGRFSEPKEDRIQRLADLRCGKSLLIFSSHSDVSYHRCHCAKYGQRNDCANHNAQATVEHLTRKSSATATGSAPGSQVKYRSHQNGISSSGGGWLERLVRPENGIASKSGMSRAASQNSGTQRYITHSWRPFFPVARTVSSLMYASGTRRIFRVSSANSCA